MIHQCTAEGAVLVDPGGDRSGVVWYGCVLSSHGESWAKYNLTEPIPLQVKYGAFEFIVEPFRPSGPCLCTMKISAQSGACGLRVFSTELQKKRKVKLGHSFHTAKQTYDANPL